MLPRKRLQVWIAAGLLLLGAPVHAAGIWIYDIASPGVGRAGAGRVATADDAVTAWSNPAGMPLLEHSELVVGVQPLYISTEFRPGPGSSVPGGDGGNAGGLVPAAAVYYTHYLSPRLRFGATFNSYFSGAVDYDNDWVGRYYVQEADISTIALTPTVGYAVNRWFSIGGGVSIVQGELDFEAAVNNALDGQSDGLLKLESDDIGFGGNAGVMFQLGKKARIGLHWRGEVDLDLDDLVDASGIGPTIQAQLDALGLTDSKVDIEVVIPQAAMLAVNYEFSEDLSVSADVGWQDWSRFGEVGVQVVSDTTTSLTTETMNKDTTRGAIGAIWRLSGTWKLSAGVAYDSSPVRSAHRTPEFPLDRQIRYGFGAHRVKNGVPRWSLSYSYVDSGNGKIDVNVGPLVGRLQGDYDPYNVHTIAFSWIQQFVK